LKKFAEKTIKIHFKSNNYEVCTAVARCFPNTNDIMVPENMNLSEGKIGRPPLWSDETNWDFCHQSPTYAVSSVYSNHKLISNVHWTEKCLISVRKLHDLAFILCYEQNSIHVNLLISKGDG
jgi:hypothetical protein